MTLLKELSLGHTRLMADHVIESRLWLPRPRAEVFALVAEPAGLPRLFPPALRVTFTRPPEPMTAGAVYDLRLRWHGVPLRWRCFVREYDPPYRFVDVQVRGPWARWEQRHRLLEADGGTWLDERLTYRPPLGPAGRLLHVLRLRRELNALWTYRRRRLAALLAPVSAEAG